jgi:hypothetical protein
MKFGIQSRDNYNSYRPQNETSSASLMTENRSRGKLTEFGHVNGCSMKDAVCKYDKQGKGRIRHKEVLREFL